MNTIHAVTFPHRVEIEPGEGGFVSVAVTNTSDVIDSYSLQVFGLDPAWVEVGPERLSLFPGETGTIDIRVNLPLDYPSSQRTIAINVVSDDDPGAFNLSNVELVVTPTADTSVAIDPTIVTSGRSATFGIVVSNTGNAVAEARGFAVDPEDLAEFTFDPASVVVAPGRDQIIRVTARGGRSWFGQTKARTFEFGVDSSLVGAAAVATEPVRVQAIGTFLQRPRIGRWMMSLLGLLTAAAVFAAVLSRSFDRVVEEASVSEDLIEAALEGDQGGAVVPSNPATVTGNLGTATSSQGLAGVQAELFAPGDTTTPVASGVTDEAGTFSLSNLPAGTYKLKLSGAGLEPLWYPAGETANEGQDIELVPGEPFALEPVAIGGLPVDVGGSVDADNPLDLAGVTITLVADGLLDPSGDALVATVDVSPDGSFTLPDVPSPGNYRLLVSKPGFATETRDVVLEPGEGIGDLQVALRPGRGVISGSVVDETGSSLGGAKVVATDGTVVVETVSLTEGSEGTFRLRNLPTPAQYTVTVSRPGYISEVRTVALDDVQQIGSLGARLVPAVGTVSGRATVSGQPEQGLTVSLTGGEVVRTTAVVSQGPGAGTYSFGELPAPGTYTLTFQGPDLVPQVRVIDLNPFNGAADVTGIDVSLARRSASVSGIIRDIDGSLEPQASVMLSDGTTTRTFLTADDPAGAFEFFDVPPGAYTLTASRTGTDPVVVLVNVAPNGAPPVLDLQLAVQASLSGKVEGFDSTTRSLTVRLFLPEQFPSGDSLATVQTDSSGNYRFTALSAPTTYVVAIFPSETAADPLDSIAVETEPSADTSVDTVEVDLP